MDEQVGGSSSRKRARVGSPFNAAAGAAVFGCIRNFVNESDLVRRLDDPNRRNGAFDRLLVLSSSHDANYALRSDLLLTRLLAILFGLLEYKK